MANRKYFGAGKPPSAWAIVLVAAILILLPTLFCGGILFMSSPGTSATHAAPHQHEPVPKRQELNP